MRYRAKLKSFRTLLFLGILILSSRNNALSQAFPNNYSKANKTFQDNSLGAEDLGLLLDSLGTLNPDEDSLSWLIPTIVERVIGVRDSVLLANTYSKFSVLFGNMYRDLNKSLEYNEKSLVLFQNIPSMSRKLLQATSLQMLMLYDNQQEKEALGYALKLKDLSEQQEEIVAKLYGYRQLCSFYIKIPDFERAEEYCRIGIRTNKKEGRINFLPVFYETLAIIKSVNGNNLDSVIYYRKKGINLPNVQEYELPVSYRNLAMDFRDLGLLDSAQLYFNKSIQLSKKYPWPAVTNSTFIEYARFLLMVNQPEKAASIIDSLLQNAPLNSGELGSLYKVKLGISYELNDYRAFNLTLIKRDSLLMDKYDREKAASREEMVAKYELVEKEAKNIRLEQKNESYKSFIALFIIILLALLIVLLLLRDRAKKREEFLELKADKEVKQLKFVQDKFEFQREQLRDNINELMMQQNRNLELMEMVEEIRSSSENKIVENKAIIIQRKLKSYSSEDTLMKLRRQGKNVYPKLYDFLEDHPSGSNKVEITYCLMIVMKYSQEEVARALQRSDKAIKSLRYRIRKKLKLPENESLIDFLNSKI
tara:strand:- start:32311 stop:34086 length:1776 start_codon:yes stop_codon:yes gene_type:complete